eukprot:CAMPEP_0178900240 /NCGR_PEP_ID=MMETSP0786-20121207/3366_1 /TAXON_ID=186022 /ORGANISM="Thalassionema frauenfeldii, Strain CCMP 1798" /LENGTH=1080 /DNA_ID=CAMNT_0020571227 /DNA_START=69 /DNA_END=3310 /DNA_ORIENTATION=-
MSLFRPGGQFDDAEDESASAEQKLQGELDLARVTGTQASAASRISAASRLGALNFSPGSALARAAADRNSASDATASYLSLLQNAGGESHASPYYQRQRYRPAYLNAQSPYAALPSATEASLAYARRAGTYTGGYHASSGKQEGSNPPGYPNNYASPHRDFTSYYQRQAQDLSSAALLDRAYQLQDNKVLPGQAVSTSALQYLAKSQSTPKPAPGSTATTSSAVKMVNTPEEAEDGGLVEAGVRGSGRGGRGANRSPKTPPATATPEKVENEVDNQRWYSGCVPLGLPEDKFWLSELQVYLRSNFAEAFGATEADIAAPMMDATNKPIALGQVGIRCMHCRNDPPSERGQQATSYPSLISGIYNSVQQMLRLHFDCCLSMPAEVRQKIEQLKVSSSARGGRKQYWIDSAKRLGLVDTPHGIHFGRDPYGPLPPLSGPSGTAEEEQKSKLTPKSEGKEEGKENGEEEAVEVPQVEPYPLVLPEDQPLISDYLYLTLEQMSPCNLMEADKVGCYKGRKVGFPGLACKHCVGQAGCGRYFPASEASLSQTTTSQTIMNHVRNCRRCPIEIRENLELMKRARMGPDGKRADKPKHGGRKVFFHRLWCRIQRIPLSDDEGGKKKSSRKKKEPKRAVKKRQPPTKFEDSEAEEEVDQRDEDTENTSDETETDQDEDSSDEEKLDGDFERSPRYMTSSKGRQNKKKAPEQWFEGCVRLTKTDDPHWLSEMQCYVRSDLVEVFSHKRKDPLDGYGGRKEPGIGQVGIRCVFCKTLPKAERSSGCIYFPDTLAAIHTKVGDMIRLHFPSCPAMPDDVKSTFRSNRGFGAKADGDAQQYWIDAARDIGLCDAPAGGDVWGIRFHKDPLQPSAADNLDRENAGATSYHFRKTSLVRAEDKGMCTDHVMLLLRQVKPCRFKKSDRRGGPSARGRDRVIGFPGLCCKHCSSKNNFGRYFPVSAKNLTDNTANSLQAHMLSCSRCPESIKASLAFLMHRSSLQKAELSGSWKKSFFKHVWERLHLERAWSKGGERKDDDEEEEDERDVDDDDDDKSMSADEKTLDGKIENSQSDSEEEDACEAMTDLIKAAAVW